MVSLRTDSGAGGLGEFVAPEPGDLGEPATSALVADLEGVHLADPVALEGALRRLDRRPFVGRMARAATESAIVDLLAHVEGRSIAAWLTPNPRREVALNALVGVSAPNVAAGEARALAEAGFGCLKLKGGNEEVAALLRRVAAIREAVGRGVALRLDLNGTLDVRSAADVLEQLTAFELEYVEQPIALSAGVAALARLRRRSAIPIAADESVRDVGTARALLRSGAADVLVIKPARVGGLRQAHAIIELAEAAGVAVTVSTLLETGVGIAAALQLAATVSDDRAHGLATAGLLESDLLSRPLEVIAGRHGRAPGPGSGRAARRGRRGTVPGRMSARVPDWLMARASADPDGLAIAAASGRWTNRELDAAADGLAAALGELGAGEGSSDRGTPG